MAKRKRHAGRKVITVLACGLVISGIMGTGGYAESVETEEEISVQVPEEDMEAETQMVQDTETDISDIMEDEEPEESAGMSMREALEKAGIEKILMTGRARDNGKECIRVMSGTGESFLLFQNDKGLITAVKSAETGEWIPAPEE